VDKARLLVASLPYSGDCLHVPPVTAVGLTLLSDEGVRVAVTDRLGCKACEPHTCVCGKTLDGCMQSSSSLFSADFNKLKALALELGVHSQRCAQFDRDKISVCADS